MTGQASLQAHRVLRAQYRPIVMLGIPIVIGQVGTVVLSFADTMMIGHHSTPELAAAAFVGNMFALGILVALGFSYGMTPIVGNHYGRGETAHIGAVVKNGLLANTLLAVLLVAAYAVLYLFLDRLGQPPALIPHMRPYFLVNLASLPFVCWFNVFKQTADGTTDTRTPMWILLGGNLLNIVGNWALIYGHLGCPELGLLGAGLSTLLARIMMTAAIAGVFFGSRRYRPLRRAFAQSRCSRPVFGRLQCMGWPLGLQMGMETGAWTLCSIIVGWIGASSLAAHQVMLSVSQLFYQVYYAIGAAVAIRISLFHGQRNFDHIAPTAWAGFHLILLVAVLVSVPVWLLRHQMGWLFTDSAEVAHIVTLTIVPLVVYQLSDGLQCTFANALRGLSDVKPMMLVAFVAYFVVSIPLSYLFGITMHGGLVGVWSAFPFGLSVAGGLYYLFFRRRLHAVRGS